MKSLLRTLCAIPMMSIIGYLIYLGYTGQWLYFGMVWIAIFVFVLVIFMHNPWDF